MKKIFAFSLLLLLFSLPVFAQPGNLAIRMNPLPNTPYDWELTFDFVAPVNADGAFVLQLPEGLLPVPFTVKINGNTLWLQNLLTVPEDDSVIAWQFIPEGLLLLFKPGVLKQGDRVEINCLLTVKEPDKEPKEVTLKAVKWSAGKVQIDNRVLASGMIPAFANR